jgi:hypothetical protein
MVLFINFIQLKTRKRRLLEAQKWTAILVNNRALKARFRKTVFAHSFCKSKNKRTYKEHC